MNYYTPSFLGQLLFLISSWAWALSEVAINLRQGQPGVAPQDRYSRYLIIGAMGIALFLASAAATSLHRFDITFQRAAVFYFGIFLIVAGIALRWLAIWQLGQFFVPEVTILPGQRVVDRGLYRYVRHPSYSAVFVTILGLGLAMTNWLSLLVLVAINALTFAFRIRVEEAALVDAFGDEYRRYMRRTKRLVPFLLLLALP